MAPVPFSWASKDGVLCPCGDQLEGCPPPVRTFWRHSPGKEKGLSLKHLKFPVKGHG